MRVTIKLYATLRKYLPENADRHAIQIEIDRGDSPQSVLERFHVPPEQTHLVLLNGVYLAPQQRASPVLKDGDTLAVWPPVAGG